MNQPTTPFLEILNLSKNIGSNNVIKEVSTSFSRFEKLAITGETGSGKSTLLKLLYGLEQPDSGAISFMGDTIKGPDFQLIAGHPQIGYLDQHAELPKHYFIKDLISFNNEFTPEETMQILKICKTDHLLERKTAALSGGERQRVALALKLLKKPLLLLLDEPFSNLDGINKKIIYQVLEDLTEKLKLTIILVSHEIEDILSWSERLIVMKEGSIIQDGPTKSVYLNPVSEYCAGLLGYYTVVDNSLLQWLQQTNISEEKITADALTILRPEHMKLKSTDSSEYALPVKKNIFLGNHSLAGVEINHKMIWVRTDPEEFQVGMPVTISLKANSLPIFSVK
jgi:iron(III) transport system ATP-binding protein